MVYRDYMGSLFKLLERINMRFPTASGGLNDKVRFNEKVNFVLTRSDGSILRNK